MALRKGSVDGGSDNATRVGPVGEGLPFVTGRGGWVVDGSHCEELVHLTLADAIILKSCAQVFLILRNKWPNRPGAGSSHDYANEKDCTCSTCRSVQAVRDEYERIEAARDRKAR